MEGVIVLPPQSSTFYFDSPPYLSSDLTHRRKGLTGIVRKQAARPLNLRRKQGHTRTGSETSSAASVDTCTSSLQTTSESSTSEPRSSTCFSSSTGDDLKTTTLTVPKDRFRPSQASFPLPPSPSAIFHSVGSRANGVSTLPSHLVKDSALSDLYNNVCCRYLLPILDLQIPRHTSNNGQRALTYRDDFLTLSLQHLPLFWALMLCGATIVAGDESSDPATAPMVTTFRHLAIRSLNSSMASESEDPSLKAAILCTTATLAAWERVWGSMAAWKAHCRGFDLLARQNAHCLDLRYRTLARHLLLGGMDAILTHRKSQPDCHSQDLMREAMVPLPAGFDALRKTTSFHHDLLYTVCDLAHLDRGVGLSSQTHMLRSCAAQLVDFDLQSAYADVICRDTNKSRSSDRRMLEMLTLIQYAGLCLVAFLAEDVPISDLENIAFDRIYANAIRLARNVMRDSAYEEVALWALWIITVTTTVTGSYRRLRDEPKDLRYMMIEAGVGSWADMENVLQRHIYPRSLIALSCGYWQLLELGTLESDLMTF